MQHSLASDHDHSIGLYESRPFSRLSKCPLPFSFQLKITPSLPLQPNVAMVGSRNVSCSANNSKKSNPTLNIGGRAREIHCKKYCEKSIFPKIYVDSIPGQLFLSRYFMNECSNVKSQSAILSCLKFLSISIISSLQHEVFLTSCY